jgi:hypothetical protein
MDDATAPNANTVLRFALATSVWVTLMFLLLSPFTLNSNAGADA